MADSSQLFTVSAPLIQGSIYYKVLVYQSAIKYPETGGLLFSERKKKGSQSGGMELGVGDEARDEVSMYYLKKTEKKNKRKQQQKRKTRTCG